MSPISRYDPLDTGIPVGGLKEDEEVEAQQAVQHEEEGPDGDHLSANAASPIVRLLVQARKDTGKLTSTSTADDISAIVKELQQTETLTLAAPFNAHKELHILNTILDSANTLQTNITNLQLPASADLTSLITALNSDITTVEGKITTP
ncbi:MAG: hypothetical protein JSR46_05825 [Verrucomicrobia bacterium]|nr:hypothetical protein [Verrucomicrobiota bacterium]